MVFFAPVPLRCRLTAQGSACNTMFLSMFHIYFIIGLIRDLFDS